VVEELHLDFVISISTEGNVNLELISDVLVTSGDAGMTKSTFFCLCNLVILEN